MIYPLGENVVLKVEIIGNVFDIDKPNRDFLLRLAEILDGLKRLTSTPAEE